MQIIFIITTLDKNTNDARIRKCDNSPTKTRVVNRISSMLTIEKAITNEMVEEKIEQLKSIHPELDTSYQV
jgi:hypothetical protein